MSNINSLNRRGAGPARTGAAAITALVSLGMGCHPTPPVASLPKPGTPVYQQMVSAFYAGVVTLDAGDTVNPPDLLGQATKLVPQEPAAWADLALYQLRLSNFVPAKANLDKAHALVPSNLQIVALQGLLAKKQGDFPTAIADFNQVIAADPSDIKTRYSLYDALNQQSAPDSAKQCAVQLQAILKIRPDNVIVALALAQLAATSGDLAMLKATVDGLQVSSVQWPSAVRAQYVVLKGVVDKGAGAAEVVPEVKRLGNVLETTPQFAVANTAIDRDGLGSSIDRFLALQTPTATPAAPDTSITFAAQPLDAAGKWSFAKSVWLAGDGGPSTVVARNNECQVISPKSTPIKLAFPGRSVVPIGPQSILPIDWNNDARVDLACAGASGLRLYQQSATGSTAFTDITGRVKLPASILGASYTAAWAADLISGGSLDIVLGSQVGAPVALRNNDDGTFTAIHPFPGAADGVRAFAWADLDSDGVPDAAIVDGKGDLSLYHNLRSGSFEKWPSPATIGKVIAIAVADVGRTGKFGLLAWGQDGAVRSISRADGGDWSVSAPLVSANAPSDGSGQLLVADLDNNGGMDLVATSSNGTQIWLSDANAAFQPLAAGLDGRSVSIYDDGTSGHLGLAGVSAAGVPTIYASHGAKSYHWQSVKLKSVSQGDGRNNSFGIDGDFSLRAGLLFENQMVTAPVTHFGLGEYTKTDVARIIWPNGSPQAELELKPDQVVEAPERLKGSCPWLFAWNGHSMAFVTDFLWRSALGLRIDAQITTGGGMSGDWNKIEADQLVPHDGYYDLRLTTQLWEAYFFDQIKLMTVDHPVGTDMWVDERFSVPPPALAYHIMTAAQPIVRATDDRGQDVTDVLKARDGNYLDTFGLGRYQGVTRDHYVELDLGKAPSTMRPGQREWLLANGWIHPTDSSINMLMSEGTHPRPTSLSLQIPDGRGGWRTVKHDLGFPEGKNKTILIDLTGMFQHGDDRRVRLRNNLELYWDWIATATEVSGARSKSTTLSPSVADLHYRGFNARHQAKFSSPEVPDYDHIEAVGQQWRDMTGYFTRYGDVRPLLASIDDRYVIMNAGDELAMRFPEQAPAPAGWVRDFIITGDGWGKDCDINSGFSKTVLPLPSHADLSYSRTPSTLENDPVYRVHRADWDTYQTRYVAPHTFENALRPHD